MAKLSSIFLALTLLLAAVTVYLTTDRQAQWHPRPDAHVDRVAAAARVEVADQVILWNLVEWQHLDIRTRSEGHSVLESIRKLCAPGNTSYGAAGVREDNPFLTDAGAATVVATSMKSYDGTIQVCDLYR